MPLALKNYQTQALQAIEGFLTEARGTTTLQDVTDAFARARRAALGEAAPAVPYRPFSNDLPAVPQACIRIPTGGGKTLLAAHALERAARLYVGSDAPVALWLVPSNTIRKQTLDALKSPGHPYREALLAYYPADRLSVIDIADCDQLRAQDFGGRAIVVVGTIQTLRVGETASRDVYSYKEAFEPHFSGLPDADYFERIKDADLEAQPYLGRSDLGKVKRSFANLLAFHRPVVIVDEAHNAQTTLSMEVLQRIRPACVLEWTATPAREQNVLYHVSAQELKAEAMIKLPIVLAPNANWQEAVRDALLTRDRLSADAALEPDYLRPIVLFQADAVNGDVPVDKLKTFLTADRSIDEKRIAVATGTQRELDGVNLFDRTCPVDFVITVEALKEGWDCSFAYVFCTVQNIRSARDMEQLLGRVLRMPYARRRSAETLNRAYAHVCSTHTAEVATQLTDRLISMGFEEIEAATFVQEAAQGDLLGTQPRQPAATVTTLPLGAAVAQALQQAAPTAVATATVGGTTQAIVTGLLPPAAIDAAVAAAPKREKDAVRRQLERHQAQAHAAAAPAERGDEFAPVPQLAVPVQGEIQLFEPELLAELATFSLAAQSADLPGFTRDSDAKPYLIDIDGARLRIEQDRSAYTLDLNLGHDGIRREGVIRELDRRIRRGDLLQADMIAWLGRAIDGLEARGIELAYQARHLNRLADAMAARVEALAQQGRRAAFQQSLIPGPNQACLSAHIEFRFDPRNYPARWFFNGRYNFAKHFYPRPGELQDDLTAEETACAIELDSLDEVKFWVRNLERQPVHSFWLPTSTDRFYPDFVAQLNDGRIFVVEYKGADRYTNDDSKEKRTIGKVWADASQGKCRFAMVTDAATAGLSVSAQLRAGL